MLQEDPEIDAVWSVHVLRVRSILGEQGRRVCIKPTPHDGISVRYVPAISPGI